MTTEGNGHPATYHNMAELGEEVDEEADETWEVNTVFSVDLDVLKPLIWALAVYIVHRGLFEWTRWFIK